MAQQQAPSCVPPYLSVLSSVLHRWKLVPRSLITCSKVLRSPNLPYLSLFQFYKAKMMIQVWTCKKLSLKSQGFTSHYFSPEPACVAFSLSVMSHSLRPHGLQPARLLCPWDSPGKNTAVGCHFLLQGIFQPREWTQILVHGLTLLTEQTEQFTSPTPFHFWQNITSNGLGNVSTYELFFFMNCFNF